VSPILQQLLDLFREQPREGEDADAGRFNAATAIPAAIGLLVTVVTMWSALKLFYRLLKLLLVVAVAAGGVLLFWNYWTGGDQDEEQDAGR
jgi:hypothetical protein